MEISDRKQTRIDESHDAMDITFRMHAASERDAWLRALPNPIPSTHELVVSHRWEDEMHVGVTISVQPKKVAASDPADQGRPVADPPQTGAPLTERDGDELIRLKAKTVEDLRTIAAERNIELPHGHTTKAQIVAKILEGAKGAKANA